MDALSTPTKGAGRNRLRDWLRVIGPGVITGAADDDPSGIGTYSVAGAQFGLGMLWLTPVLLPLMIAVQEMCGRLGAVTGRGLAAVLKEHYHRSILWGAVALLIAANTMNIWADLNAMAASARMLLGLPFAFWLTLVSVGTALLLVFVPYRLYVRYLKWLTLALFAYVVTVFLPGVHVNWRDVARNLVTPHWPGDPAYITTLVGFIGTTISPYLFFWQAGETVEEQVAEGEAAEPGHRLKRVTDEEIRRVRGDTVVGMAFSQLITFFIMVCTASTLHARGITHIATAQDAAKALQPLGSIAYLLFTLGIVGTGLLAVPTLAGSVAYAVAETAGWRYGLYRRFNRARGFYLTIALVTLAAYGLNFLKSVDPITGLLYSAVLNGAVAPPLIVMLILMCNNRRVVGERTNGPASNVLGWLTAGLMGLATVVMIWSLATGRS